MRTPALLLILLGAAGWTTPSSKVLFQAVGRNHLERHVLIGEGQFNKRNILSLSRGFLESHSTMRVAKLLICTNPQDSIDAEFGKATSHLDYHMWRERFKQRLEVRHPLAEVILIRGAGTVAIRDADGRVERVVLDSSDPLLFRTAAGVCRLIDLRLRFRTVDRTFRIRPTLDCYLVTDAEPSADVARAAAEAISTRIGATSEYLTVGVRRDSWFIGNPRFPTYYPFETDLTPPSEGEYRNSTTASCLGDVRGFSCFTSRAYGLSKQEHGR